jgi:BrnA antitoxin of type II toxin-antitoxin system
MQQAPIARISSCVRPPRYVTAGYLDGRFVVITWTPRDGRQLVRRGRPKSASPKEAVSLRLDPDVVAHYRATGPGWQSRINEALRQAAKLKARG